MSYEGYTEALCENGHHETQDVYDTHRSHNPMEWSCHACGGQFVWWNDVDTTNGEDETSGLYENQIRLEPLFEGNEDAPEPIYSIPPEGVGFHRPPDERRTYPRIDTDERGALLFPKVVKAIDPLTGDEIFIEDSNEWAALERLVTSGMSDK